jgi:hypothetical protein
MVARPPAALDGRCNVVSNLTTQEVKMSDEEHVYGEVDNEADLRKIYEEICSDIARANTREELTKLYRRAGYLITLTYSPAWREKFGDQVEELRRMAEREFAATARALNQRAAEIGAEPDYDETWGN